MSIHTRIQIWTIGALTAVAFAGSTLPTFSTARMTPEADAHARPSAPFAWPGVFDVVAIGFPDGERKAVMHIARTDTTYTLVSLQGPPGTLVRFHVAGDSARVIWNLGRELMVVDLRGSGDSLTGAWESGDWSGTLAGVRRP